MADNFAKGSAIRKVNIEPAIGIGAGRALLLQLAHPAVAQGVQDHSEFKANPFKRLQGTVEATYTIVFGPEDLADGVGRRVRWIHEFIVGQGYAAKDPANLLWVHATLTDTALRCYEELVEELPPQEAEAYYQDMKRAATFFGCALEDQPGTLADFRRYWDEQVASIEVTDVGKELSLFILDPQLPLKLHIPLRPALRLHRLMTLGSLPPEIRDQLPVGWGPADEARYRRWQRRFRRIFRLQPRWLRTLGPKLAAPGVFWLARRHVRQFDRRMQERTAPAA